MTDDFDRTSFASRLMEAGTSPEAAAAYAGLFEEVVIGTLATKAHIAALQAQIADLRNEIGAEAALLLPRQMFFDTMRKLNYRAYLEILQFSIALAVYGVIALILLAILWKLF